MLVLARQREESIMIGDDIEVRIVDLRADKVRLGISAPKSVSVHRKEVYEAIRRENRAAANLSPAEVSPLVGPPRPDMKIVPQEKENSMTSMSSVESDPFLRAAIGEAKKGLSEGGLPIGSVLVRNNQIIAAGHNRRVQHGDPMAHAEIDCLTKAGRQKTYRDTVLYSTLMPCYLCTGAVLQFGVPTVIVGESVNFSGGEGKWGKSPDFMRANGIELIDLNDPECIQMMQ